MQVVHKRPFLRVVIDCKSTRRKVLVDQLEGRHPKAQPDENHWTEEVHHEALWVPRHHQGPFLQQSKELSAKILGVVFRDRVFRESSLPWRQLREICRLRLDLLNSCPTVVAMADLQEDFLQSSYPNAVRPESKHLQVFVE